MSRDGSEHGQAPTRPSQAEARAELATAAALLRELGMAFWLPAAEDELASVRG